MFLLTAKHLLGKVLLMDKVEMPKLIYPILFNFLVVEIRGLLNEGVNTT